MTASHTAQPTDFLIRMIAKARGVASAIAPRLPSLFEPLPRVAVAPSDEPAEQPVPTAASDPRDATAAVSEAPQQRTARETPALSIPRVDVGETRDEGGRTDEPPGAEVREERPRAAASLLPTPAVRNVTERSGRRESDHAVLTETYSSLETGASQRSNASALNTNARPRGQRALAPTFTTFARKLEDPPTRSREPTGMRPEPGRNARQTASAVLIPEPKRESNHIASGTLMPVPAASVVPHIGVIAAGQERRPLRDPDAVQPAQGPSAPVINVTIGRVEVRAVKGSPARPRVDPAKPSPLSLDDYLKQRGGGR
jgi:hypothetical protein